MLISGWFETEEGAGFIEVSDVDTVGDLACVLYANYGVEVVGVDIELEGEYTGWHRCHHYYDKAG